jgi:hypothetical protein
MKGLFISRQITLLRPIFQCYYRAFPNISFTSSKCFILLFLVTGPSIILILHRHNVPFNDLWLQNVPKYKLYIVKMFYLIISGFPQIPSVYGGLTQ